MWFIQQQGGGGYPAYKIPPECDRNPPDNTTPLQAIVSKHQTLIQCHFNVGGGGYPAYKIPPECDRIPPDNTTPLQAIASKHQTLIQCHFNVGSLSVILAQHCNNTGSMSCVCWAVLINSAGLHL